MDQPELVPPPPAYVAMTQARAMWESFGIRPDDISAREWHSKVVMLQIEAADQRKRAARNSK